MAAASGKAPPQQPKRGDIKLFRNQRLFFAFIFAITFEGRP